MSEIEWQNKSLRAAEAALRNAVIEECARAIEDYHAGPQAVGKVLAGVIRKLKTV